MAKVIEFRVPANFKPRRIWTAPDQRGRLLQFPRRPRREPVETPARLMKLSAALRDVPLLRQIPMV
jgi:hypothetical protein